MGGQACVFYGAAQVSKDVDFLILADEGNYERLLAAMSELQAPRIAVPPFAARFLERGHAAHFRCQAEGVEGLRIDVMTQLRDLPGFDYLWDRRTSYSDETGMVYDLLSIPDLVLAKKTQRNKDWPVIELLANIHFEENHAAPTPEWIQFWLREIRTPEHLKSLVEKFPSESDSILAERPLLQLAMEKQDDALQTALDAEMRAEQAKDRIYWEPLKREMEEFRREHARKLRDES